jgi:hypothetical protein
MPAASTVIAICRAVHDDCDGCSEKITESISEHKGMNFHEKVRTGRYGKHALQGDGAQKAHGRYGRNGLIKPERDSANVLVAVLKRASSSFKNYVPGSWSRRDGNQACLPWPRRRPAWKFDRLHLQTNRSRRSKDWDIAHLTKDSLAIDG